MATPRKRWFKVADSIAVEPWSNDATAAFVRLAAHLNTRWARDGIDGPEAGRAVLRPGILLSLTGCGSVARGRRVLRELATHITLTVDEQGVNTVLEWRKFPVFQGYESEPGEAPGKDAPHTVPPPTPISDSEIQKKNQNSEAAAEPAAPATDPVPAEPEAPPGRPPWGPLANLLGAYGTTPAPDAEERTTWLERIWPEIDAAAEAESPDDATPRQKSAARKRIALARWRVYVTTNRSIRREIDERREIARLTAFRDAVYSRPPPVIEPDDGEMPLISIGGSS